MRVAVVGATGNVGTSLLQRLEGDSAVESVVGIARRRPTLDLAKTTWVEADIRSDDLTPRFRGADAVVHLAWAIQPSHDLAHLRRTNVHGSDRVFAAVAEAGVPALVYASSVGAYSRGPKHASVDESWPTDGIATSFYARHKAEVERLLDRFEAEHTGVRVVRLRPALIFKREAASGVRRLFAGPLLLNALANPRFVPVFPKVRDLRFQGVHSLDVGDAYRLALTNPVRGAFNIAADPVLDSEQLARVLEARLLPFPGSLLRAAVGLSWRLHLQPTPPGWVDLALGVPLLDSGRAERELGWQPQYSSVEAFEDLLQGVREGAGLETPPLSPRTAGPLRAREILTGTGSREDA